MAPSGNRQQTVPNFTLQVVDTMKSASEKTAHDEKCACKTSVERQRYSVIRIAPLGADIEL